MAIVSKFPGGGGKQVELVAGVPGVYWREYNVGTVTAPSGAEFAEHLGNRVILVRGDSKITVCPARNGMDHYEEIQIGTGNMFSFVIAGQYTNTSTWGRENGYYLVSETGSIYFASGYPWSATEIDTGIAGEWLALAPGRLSELESERLLVVGRGTVAAYRQGNSGDRAWFKIAMPVDSEWVSAAASELGNSFVAVSYDAIAYVKPTSNTTAPTVSRVSNVQGENIGWKSVDYGASRFVVVGEEGIIYSEDGLNWTKANAPGEYTWAKVVWTGSSFIALADGGTLAWSTDGASWTIITYLPMNADWGFLTRSAVALYDTGAGSYSSIYSKAVTKATASDITAWKGAVVDGEVVIGTK